MKILGELEQKIMNIIWDQNTPVAVKDVVAVLNDDSAYTTVMTVMKRLVDKGLLNRELSGKNYVYIPKTEKKDFAKSKLEVLFESIVSSYGELAISQFVDALKKNPHDLETLKEYLDRDEK